MVTLRRRKRQVFTRGPSLATVRRDDFPRMTTPETSRSRLGELAGLFLKLGATAFGGPAAHLALMEEEVVRRRQWLTREEFLDLLGATNLIPGPNSTEMAIHIGHRRAGWAGWLVAGACFILPAALIVAGFAWAYQRYGGLPEVAGILYGVKPVIIAVVLRALWSLRVAVTKNRWVAGMGLAAALLNGAGVNELIVLFAAGIVVALAQRKPASASPGGAMPALALAAIATPATAATSTASLGAIFWFFLKIGSVLFGSGYVLLAFLRADLVERWHWLTEAQLLDAVAIGQVTPGPVFTTATFIGYLLGGWTGAGAATLGIFLPAFFFVAISGPLIPRLRRSPSASAFLDGVNAASLALMAVVTAQLFGAGIVDGVTLSLAILSAVLIWRGINSTWLVLGGAIAGFLRVLWG